MLGHTEAIVIQLTGKVVPLTFQIFLLSLCPSRTLAPFCVSLLSKRTSVFKCTTTVQKTFCIVLLLSVIFFLTFPLLICLLLPSDKVDLVFFPTVFWEPCLPFSSFSTCELFPADLHHWGWKNKYHFSISLNIYCTSKNDIEGRAAEGRQICYGCRQWRTWLILFLGCHSRPLPPPAIVSGSE